MSGRVAAGPSLGGLAIAVVLAACASSPTGPPASEASSPSGGAPTPAGPAATPSPAASPAPASPSTVPSPPINVTVDVAYESPDARGLAKKLDVYVPAGAGPWPVVVMLHGGGLWKGILAEWATAVAADGFAIFAPNWTEQAPGLTPRETYTANSRHAACAVAFVREHAGDYGADPTTLVVFGHSGGGNVGAFVALDVAEPSTSCLASDTPATVTGLVTFEGDWLSMNPELDDMITADPAVLDALTPWRHLDAAPGLPVIALVADGSGGVVDVPALDPPVAWRTERDPLALRQRFLAAGIRPDVAQEQAIFAAALEARGHPASLRELPGSGHSTLGEAGLEVLRQAIRDAVGQ